MKKGVLLGVLLLLLIPSVVLAAAYSATITVTESDGETYTQLPVAVSVDNAYLADNSFISATGLDTRVLDDGTPLDCIMVVGDRTLFVSDIAANTQHLFSYTTENAALDAFSVVVGYDGYITVADHADLELGDSFIVELRGYVDTDSGSDKNLVFKNAAFKLYISAEGSIKAEITGGTSVTAVNVSSGVHTVNVTADGIDLEISIDGATSGDGYDSSSLGGVGVPDNSSSWVFMQNDVLAYVEYIKIWTSE